jgi:hypothetical protein
MPAAFAAHKSARFGAAATKASRENELMYERKSDSVCSAFAVEGCRLAKCHTDGPIILDAHRPDDGPT